MKKRGCLLIAMVFMAVLFFAMPCEAAAKSKISKKNAKLCVGETLQLKLSGGTGTTTWSSNKKKIASVSKNGLVTAKKEGSCVITAKRAGRKYKCKITVTPLPKGYATVDGKKVKVGSTVKITYRIQSKKPIAYITINYKYNRSALKIVNEESDDRYKNWVANEYYPAETSGYDIAHLWGVDPKHKYDSYDTYPVDCKKAKTVEVMKVKVLKGGNYKITAKYRYVMQKDGSKVTGYKVTETVK